MSQIYFRIQPAGLGLAHKSESSDGVVRKGIDAFLHARDLLRIDGARGDYGDEIVIFQGGKWWDNHDVEGVRVDGDSAHVIRRMTWDEFDDIATSALGLSRDAAPFRGGYEDNNGRHHVSITDEPRLLAALIPNKSIVRMRLRASSLASRAARRSK